MLMYSREVRGLLVETGLTVGLRRATEASGTFKTKYFALKLGLTCLVRIGREPMHQACMFPNWTA